MSVAVGGNVEVSAGIQVAWVWLGRAVGRVFVSASGRIRGFRQRKGLLAARLHLSHLLSVAGASVMFGKCFVELLGIKRLWAIKNVSRMKGKL